MNPSQSNTGPASAAAQLGNLIRDGRKAKGWTIARLAEQIGRPREWVNRVELGYGEYGEHKPPSSADLRAIIDCLGSSLGVSGGQLLALGLEAEQQYLSYKQSRRPRPRPAGKLTQAEIIIGEQAVVGAIIDLIDEQHSDAVIRNTGIRGLGSYLVRTAEWNRYRERLGRFLADNPNGIFKRVEYVASNAYLAVSRESDEKLAYQKPLREVHNARIKFRKGNPLSLHLLIGQREAILALPRSSGQPGSNMALLVRDKLFVEALRLWYDEVLWEGPEPSVTIDYTRFEESFQQIREMYGYED